MSKEIYQAGRLVLSANDSTRTVTTYNQAGAVLATRPYTADENAAADTEAAERLRETTRLSLDDKVRQAVAQGGTLDAALGSADVAWAPGNPLTLRGWKAMSLAQMRALTLAQTQELLAKLAPALVDIAKALMQDGKLTVQLHDDAG